MLARVVFAPLSDRLTTGHLTVGVLAPPGIAAMLLLLVDTRAAWAAIVLLGLSNGAVPLLRTLWLARLCTPASYGRVAGAAFVTLAKAAAPMGAAIAIDATGSYSLMLIAMIGLSAASTACGRKLFVGTTG